MTVTNERQRPVGRPAPAAGTITLFLCGDVMTGRGIDQVLPHPGDPAIHEPYLKHAGGYVRLAEEWNGPFPQPLDPAAIWGDTLAELARFKPDLRLINLETSITTCDDYWPAKGINYRMHPANIDCLTAAGIDYCALANNHVLDWGYAGLQETLETLRRAGLGFGGAGKSLAAARKPAVFDLADRGRILIWSCGLPSSGILQSWAAGPDRPGVYLLERPSLDAVRQLAVHIESVRRPGDRIVVSLHWGGNWGYEIADGHRAFARQLIDMAGADLVYGHSSHHVLGLELYRGKLILYGCGDFLNDYEGISGHEEYRADLGLMYFVTLDAANGDLERLQMIPTRIRHFRVNRAARSEGRWLREVLNRDSQISGRRVEMNRDGRLILTV